MRAVHVHTNQCTACQTFRSGGTNPPGYYTEKAPNAWQRRGTQKTKSSRVYMSTEPAAHAAKVLERCALMRATGRISQRHSIHVVLSPRGSVTTAGQSFILLELSGATRWRVVKMLDCPVQNSVMTTLWLSYGMRRSSWAKRSTYFMCCSVGVGHAC